MAYTTNISAFLPTETYSPLLDAYRILVAIELAFKDVGYNGAGGHDIPSMLAQAAIHYPLLASQLNAHQARLRTDLVQLICNNARGQPAQVLANNYPHVRYTRFAGDWGGVSETTHLSVRSLAQTCNNLLVHLQTHKATLGIQL